MRTIRLLHKWLGLLIGLQMCLWLISGGVMALLNHSTVSGEHHAQPARAAELAAGAKLFDPAALRDQYGSAQIHAITLQTLGGDWVWRVATDSGSHLHQAIDGSPLRIDETQAREIARRAYGGDGPALAAERIERTIEVRDHAGPVWRVSFDDAQNTRYYISAEDGALLERRNSTWAIFDVFWMLHTMDYVTRDNFNNPLVIFVAFLSLWLALSGALLLLRSFTRRDLPRWLRERTAASRSITT